MFLGSYQLITAANYLLVAPLVTNQLNYERGYSAWDDQDKNPGAKNYVSIIDSPGWDSWCESNCYAVGPPSPVDASHCQLRAPASTSAVLQPLRPHSCRGSFYKALDALMKLEQQHTVSAQNLERSQFDGYHQRPTLFTRSNHPNFGSARHSWAPSDQEFTVRFDNSNHILTIYKPYINHILTGY